MKELRILICGGRKFTDYELVEKVVLAKMTSYENTLPVTFISGECDHGADQANQYMWDRYHCDIERFPANWNDLTEQPCVIKQGRFSKYNALAGHNRNQRMIDEGKPNLVFAFWDGKSTGTADMITRAHRAKIQTIITKY